MYCRKRLLLVVLNAVVRVQIGAIALKQFHVPRLGSGVESVRSRGLITREGRFFLRLAGPRNPFKIQPSTRRRNMVLTRQACSASCDDYGVRECGVLTRASASGAAATTSGALPANAVLPRRNLNLLELPPEITMKILGYLPMKKVAETRLVSRPTFLLLPTGRWTV
jgi:hypothetical protein